MNDILFLLPEIYLAFTLALVIASEVAYHGEPRRLITGLALLGLGGAFIQTLLAFRVAPVLVLDQALSMDGLSLFFKLFFILLGALTLLAARSSRELSEVNRPEFSALIIGCTLAMSIAVSATDVLVIFLSIQVLNILGFLLAGFSKRSIRSTEAAVKQLAFGAVSGLLFLFAIAMLFASTGSVSLLDLHRQLVQAPLPNQAALVVFVLIFLSLGFQMATFPMSLSAPDVIEGSPTPVSGYLAIAPRVAGAAVAVRLLLVLFAQPNLEPGRWQILGGVDWPRIVGLIAGLTMVSGALLALRQTSAKRLVAYLAVVESGFLLLGLLVLDQVGVGALLYSCLMQLFALTGAFLVLSHFWDELGTDRLSELKRLPRQAVPEAVALVLFLASLVGLPPLPGFIGKFALVGVALQHQWSFLAVLAVLAMAISVIALSRLAYGLMGDLRALPSQPASLDSRPRRIFLGALFIPMFLLGIFAEPLLAWVTRSIRFILW